MKVHVPDIDGPTAHLCWQQTLTGPSPMVRCDRKKGHLGLHSWEIALPLTPESSTSRADFMRALSVLPKESFDRVVFACRQVARGGVSNAFLAAIEAYGALEHLP